MRQAKAGDPLKAEEELMAFQRTGDTMRAAADGIEVNRSSLGQGGRVPLRPTRVRPLRGALRCSGCRAGTGVYALLLCWAVCQGAAAQTGRLEIHGGFAFAPLRRDEAAAYFTVVNHGTTPDTLLSARSPWAKEAVLHKTTGGGMNAGSMGAGMSSGSMGGAGGMGMERMVPAGPVEILPGDSLTLAPGGMHLMLMSLDRLWQPGDSLPLTLRFAHAGDVMLKVPVRRYGQ